MGNDFGERLERLDGNTVLRILSYLTEELQQDTSAVRSEQEARAALAALISAGDTAAHPDDPPMVLPESADAIAVGRQLLAHFYRDEATRPLLEDLVANPPQDDQMSAELALAGAVILGAVIAWVQTKIHVRVVRKGDQTEFEFEVLKESADTEVVKQVARSIGSLFVS